MTKNAKASSSAPVPINITISGISHYVLDRSQELFWELFFQHRLHCTEQTPRAGLWRNVHDVMSAAGQYEQKATVRRDAGRAARRL
ncbi:hypothetical protein J6590_027894 [Homalodisca vitripennis]|nr:hypothetical protein J6590_027894 [Homalodisca vitripennis]